MLSNLSNNNSGNQTKSVVEKKHYRDIEKRLDELQDEIEMTEQGVSTNSQAIASLDGRVAAVEDNSTFPELNTDTINPATGNGIDVTGNLDVDGAITADFANFGELSVNGTSFTTVKDNAAQAKSIAENAENKADEAYELADALSDELADYKADNEISITTGTLNADSVITDSVAAQTINTNDFETTNAEIDKLYVDTIKATGFLELPTSGQQYYTITVPAKTTASFSGVYTSNNNTDYPFYFTVSDGAVIYKQSSTEIIKDISFDRETGNTKVRFKSSTNLTYISTALDSNPVTIEDGGDAYTDYAFIPQKTGGYLIRGYDDTTTEVYIAGVLKAYALSIEEEIIERTSVDFLKVNNSIELPEDWDIGGTISYSTGEENQYISAQTKAGVTKPTWTSPIHSTIGSLSYSSKLVDEATIASYKGISETRQTQTISITNEASLQQLTAFHWTKNGTYWQPYETTRITIGDHTMWIDPTESNQGIRFYDNQVIADGTWDDTPVEEANAVPVNLVIFDAPTELSFPITNLGDKTTVHGEITATCFKGNVLGNVTGNADTATNATCFSNKTYAEACADILAGCAADSNKFNGKTYSEACADILSGNAATATNATCFDGKTYSEAKADILSGCASEADNATCFDGHTYADAKADILSGNAASATNATCFNGCTYSQAKADILSGNAASATNATCFNGCTYSQAKADILSGNAASATNATCFGGCTYSEAKADILSGTAAQAHCVDIDSLTANSYPLIMESTTCELGKSGTCSITFTPSSGILETTQVTTTCIENSGTTKSQYLCATCDINVDGNAYITGDLTVQGTITTTHSEEVVTPSENIILRDSATTPVASGCYSGFTVTNYDGQNHNLEVGANSDGTLHVGVVGGTMEPVATRATEACMENGYAAHWDSTGTDLVTKGATSTHDLCINGNATVTGTLTANLTGTADNATCLGGYTYSQAKADILSGCASEANNATCFGSKTYAEACADILAGTAACATNATNAENAALATCATQACKIDTTATNTNADYTMPLSASNCIYTSNGKTLTYNPSTGLMKVDGVETAGYKASIPSPNNTLHYALVKVESDNKESSIPLCVHVYSVDFLITHYDNCTSGVKVFGSGNYGLIGAAAPACDDGNSYYWLKICNYRRFKLSSICPVTVVCNVTTAPTGIEFTVPSVIACTDSTVSNATCLNGQTSSYYLNTSSTTQTKAGNLSIGAPAACTTTSAGGSGITLGTNGAIELYHTTPVIDFHYNKYCGNYSHRFYAGKGLLTLSINDGDGCTGCSQEASYAFKSDGTFTGACTICASCNIYSAGCPVVTTGTLPTVAPGYNCTGTSNYVVTTKVCCAEKADCIVVTDNPMTYVDEDTSTFDNIVGVRYGFYSGSNTGYPSSYGTMLTAQQGTAATSRWGFQIAKPTTNTHFYARRWVNTTTVPNDWYQLIDSTGGQTINGNLTIPTACGSFCGNLCGSAACVCRVATNCNSIYYLALHSYCESNSNTQSFVSNGCPITYNPSTGVLTTCALTASTVCNGLGVVNAAKVNIKASDIGLTAGRRYSFECVITQLTCCFCGQPAAYTGRFANNESFYVVAPDNSSCYFYNYTFEKLDTSNTIASTWQYARWKVSNYAGCVWIVTDFTGATANDHTWQISKVGDVATSICNVPTSASTTCNVTITAGCCSASAPTNYTWCFCGCNGVMYTPGSIYVGSGGGRYAGGSAELYAPSPFIDFHFNNYCGDYSSRIINGSQGTTQIIVNNGTDSTAATQTATYCFGSNGFITTPSGVIAPIIRSTYPAAANQCCDITFTTRCCNASQVCNYCMCLCGCNGKLYNPQGFMVGSCPVALVCDIPAPPTCVACATCVDLESWRDCDLYLVGTPHLGVTVSYDGPRRLVAAQKKNVSCLYYSYNGKNLYASGDKFTKDCQFVLSGCTLTITM